MLPGLDPVVYVSTAQRQVNDLKDLPEISDLSDMFNISRFYVIHPRAGAHRRPDDDSHATPTAAWRLTLTLPFLQKQRHGDCSDSPAPDGPTTTYTRPS